MEENKNKPVEELLQTEEVCAESAPPSREDILAMAREENKGGDERERQFFLKANSYAFSLGLLLAGIIILVSSLVEKRFPVEVLLITAVMQSAQSFIAARGVRKTRKLYLTLGICEGVISVCLSVFWILMLCGVVL